MYKNSIFYLGIVSLMMFRLIGFNMFDLGFSFVNIIFPLMFFLVFGLIFFQIISGLRTWNKNNHSPRLHVDAKIIDKRGDISRRRHTSGANGSMSHTHTSTTYYVTFEVTSGDRMELQVPSSEYGYLIIGDEGKLEFQGTRFLSFNRN